MILDFKATLYARAVGVARTQIDPTDPLWEARIDRHLDGAHGFPPGRRPEEYSVAFEAMYPRDRRAYIEQLVSRASYAHRPLASLVSSKQAPCVATTTFDQLIEHTTVVTHGLLPPPDQANIRASAFFSRLG